MTEIHECDCCEIFDKIMVIEGSSKIIEQKFSKEMNEELLQHFEKIVRSIDTIYEHVKKNQRLKKPVTTPNIIH